MIREVRLHHFRCFENLEFFPTPRRTCIVGENAQGKTSLLEAACVLLRLQSPRTTTATDLIQSGAEGFSIEGIYGDTRLQYRHTPDGRTIFLDSKPQQKSEDYLSTARLTWFSNADLELVKGSASARRRFLDFLGTQSVPGYRKALRDYERALRARNALLKEGRPRREIAAFDQPLVDAGEVLIASRSQLTSSLSPLAAAACLDISSASDHLEISYRPGCGESFSESLAASRQEEERLRQTVCGPHRDDVDLTLNSLKAASFASEGQQRTIALALKIAQARHIESTHNKSPVLLLDDIFGELDTARRNRLLEALPVGAQTLITTTFLDWASDEAEMTVFNLAGKILTPANPK
ncbi:MAG: DNA replication/repair protein RecF [bacterium]